MLNIYLQTKLHLFSYTGFTLRENPFIFIHGHSDNIVYIYNSVSCQWMAEIVFVAQSPSVTLYICKRKKLPEYCCRSPNM